MQSAAKSIHGRSRQFQLGSVISIAKEKPALSRVYLLTASIAETSSPFAKI
jgi:hypothetical protein